MDHQIDELLSVGKEIMDAVNEAIDGNDYSNLSRNLNSHMVNLTEELNKYNSRTGYYKRAERYTDRNTSINHNNRNERPAYIQQNVTVNKKSKYTPFKQVLPGYAGSILKVVLGITGVVCFASMASTLLLLLTAYEGTSILVPMVLSLIGAIASGSLIVNGTKDRKLLNKFYKYASLVGEEEYIPIAKLASMSNESEKTVISNIESMIKKGYLPKARLDADKKTLMLTSEVYKQYLQTTEQKLKEQKLKSEQEDALDKLNVSKEVKEIIRNGNSFVDRIQKYNDAIPDATMTTKLNDLKMIINRIFEQVKKNPSSAGDMRKLMNYYLPTTEKLLKAYIDLDKQPDTSTNVVTTKREIESAIDTINEAFNNLFDSMFEDVAWDISSDISAMKTMMAQDGLTESAVKKQQQTR